MASNITRPLSIRNAEAQLIKDAADAGTAKANAELVFKDSSDVEVARCRMSNPAFAAPSNGTIVANAIADDTNMAGGTVAKFTLVDRDGNEVYSGTVATSNADIVVGTTTFEAGATLRVDTVEYTAAA